MQGPDFVGHLPSRVSWSPDSKVIYFSWNPDQEPVAEKYQWAIGQTNTPQKMTLDEQQGIPFNGVVYNKDRSKCVFSKFGDLYLMDVANGDSHQITKTTQREQSPQFSGDEKALIYLVGDNLFSWNIEDGTMQQWTDFKSGNERKDAEKKGSAAWLEQDQLTYFEVLEDRKSESEYRKDRSESLTPQQAKTIYLGKALVSNQVMSPDGQYVTYRLVKRPPNRAGTEVPNYVTEGGYVEALDARAKVGSPQASYTTWIYDISHDTTYKVDISTIEGLYDKPDYLQDYYRGDSSFVDTFSNARAVIANGPMYNLDGSQAVVVVRSQDNKDRWIMSLDLASGGLTQIDRQHDDAWVGGPGIAGWNFSTGNIGWLDASTIWYQSEVSGYSHLYTHQLVSGKRTAITNGDYEVVEVQLSHDRKQFFIQASAEGPFEHHFYSVPVSGGRLEKMTSEVGRHDVILSPDESHCAVLFSYSNQPTELYLMENKANASLQRLTISTTSAFEAYDWRDPEIIHFTARDEVSVPARIYRPDVAKKNGAAVIFVHGAGYLHNVHKWWSSYFREYMFHNYLADQGYTVLDIDYRASAGYGRDWRTAIYRYMGGKDLDDQVDGAQYLVDHEGIDADRLGIYGGSYGGFITLMALCTAPGTFRCGAALRSVTDWAHYNHGYTANILNIPMEDSIAYFRSSPIYHAAQLEGDLVMLHGMVDTNVHFQDVVRMSQRFIEAGKDGWELAVFPMESHGFNEPSSWTDEYKRIYRLFDKNLNTQK